MHAHAQRLATMWHKNKQLPELLGVFDYLARMRGKDRQVTCHGLGMFGHAPPFLMLLAEGLVVVDELGVHVTEVGVVFVERARDLAAETACHCEGCSAPIAWDDLHRATQWADEVVLCALCSPTTAEIKSSHLQ